MQTYRNRNLTSQIGTVVSVQGDVTLVRVKRADSRRCRAGKGCGAGLLAGSPTNVEMTVETPPRVRLEAGDKVSLVIEQRDLLRGIAFAYGLPLLGALAAATACLLSGARVADWFATLAAAAGAGIGAAGGAYLARRECARASLMPRIAGLAND